MFSDYQKLGEILLGVIAKDYINFSNYFLDADNPSEEEIIMFELDTGLRYNDIYEDGSELIVDFHNQGF